MYFLDLLYVRYNCVKFDQCRICATDFREGGAFCQPQPTHPPPPITPHLWAASKNPILKRVKMLGVSFSSKLDWGFYTVCGAKNSFKKFGAFIQAMKFFSDEASLYICKSTIWPCMESCSQIWLGAPSYYSDIIDKLQKHLCRTVDCPTPAVFLESLGHRRIVASLSFFCWYYFGICSSELVELVPLPFSVRRYMHYFDRLHDISVALPSYINFYVNIVFFCTARL